MDIKVDPGIPEPEKSNQRSIEDDIVQLFVNELKEYPQVLKFIQKLQEMVERQRALLHKYHEKFKQLKKDVHHIGIQTDADDILKQAMPTDDKGGIDINSFKEGIVQAAHSAVQKSGFVYEPVSGLYYDYNTGYYYNSELGLYYDGNTSTYYYFNEESKKFEFHSQVQPQSSQQTNKKESQDEKKVTKAQCTSVKDSSGGGAGLNQEKVTLLPDSEVLSDVSSGSDVCADVIEAVMDVKSPQSHGKHSVSEESVHMEHIQDGDREDGELSSDEDIEMKLISSEPGARSESKYRTPLEYYNSPEYRAWYESYCRSVTVQYRKTPVAYDPGSEEAKNVNPALRTEEYEIANAWPPCLRIVVTETNVKGLQVGTLFLVTYLGGTIGREGEHAVLIPDINISKHHAKIEFTATESNKDDTSKGYTLVDLGSRNGTYLNNIRLSAALQESEPHLLTHGTEVRIGGSKLSVHIHQGRDTCDQCEPGVLMCASNKTPASKIDLSSSSGQNRQVELKRLRKKFGLDKSVTKGVKMNVGYEDRAERRRKTVGSQVEGEKTQVADMEERIPEENKGFRMLSKMGWKSGQTLGKDEASSSALTEPIIPHQYAKNAGLGCSTPVVSTSNSKEERKKTVWEKTQARYNVLGDEPPQAASPECED